MKFSPLSRSGVSTAVPTMPNTPTTQSKVNTPSRSRAVTPQASRSASRRTSVTREKSAYNTLSIEELDNLQGDMVLTSLWQEQQKMQYISFPAQPNEGVIVRTPQLNRYMCIPPILQEQQQPLWEIAQMLNLRVNWFCLHCNQRLIADMTSIVVLLDHSDQRDPSTASPRRCRPHRFDGRQENEDLPYNRCNCRCR